MQDFLKELFTNHYQNVYSYLYSLSRDAALSEELASDVFLEAVKSIHRFRGDSDVKTWLFSIARFKWYAYLRKKKKQPPSELLDDIFISDNTNPESDYIKKETAKHISHMLSMESERTRIVINMRMEGYSFHEIGLRLGISESSARVIDYRTRQKIRQALEREGLNNE